MASSNLQMLTKTGNNKHSDECYTPENAVLPLLQYLDKSLRWYEPTSGISKSIVKCLDNSGFNIQSNVDSNFLISDYDDYDAIITNPPYSIKDKFIEKCYETGKPFALLLPVSSIQGQKRGRMFDDKGIELLVLNKRIDFTGKGSPHFGVAWFCYNILPNAIMFK